MRYRLLEVGFFSLLRILINLVSFFVFGCNLLAVLALVRWLMVGTELSIGDIFGAQIEIREI